MTLEIACPLHLHCQELPVIIFIFYITAMVENRETTEGSLCLYICMYTTTGLDHTVAKI